MSFERVKLIQQFNKDKVKLGKDISAGEKQTGKRSLWASLGGMIGSELLMWGATTALGAATGGTAAAALKFITSPAGKALVKGLGFYGGGKVGAKAAGDVKFKSKSEEGAFLAGSRESAGQEFGMMEELLQEDILSGAVKTGAMAGIGEYAKASQLAKGADQDLSTGELLLGGSKESYENVRNLGGELTNIKARDIVGSGLDYDELIKAKEVAAQDPWAAHDAAQAAQQTLPTAGVKGPTAYNASKAQNLALGQKLGMRENEQVWQAWNRQFGSGVVEGGTDWHTAAMDTRRISQIEDYMGWGDQSMYVQAEQAGVIG